MTSVLIFVFLAGRVLLRLKVFAAIKLKLTRRFYGGLLSQNLWDWQILIRTKIHLTGISLIGRSLSGLISV